MFRCTQWMLLCFVCLVGFTGCKSKEKKAQETYVKAFQMEQGGQKQQALALYNQILRQYPGTKAALESTKRVVALRNEKKQPRSSNQQRPTQPKIHGLSPTNREAPPPKGSEPAAAPTPKQTSPAQNLKHKPVRFFSWWRVAKTKDFIVVVDQARPFAVAEWTRSCSFRSKNSTRTQSKDGKIKTGRSGYTWRVFGLWVNRNETGECKFVLQLDGKVYQHTISLKRPDTLSKNEFVSFQSRTYRNDRQKMVVAFVKSAEPSQDIAWTQNCSYRKPNGTRTNSKDGKTTTGRWTFKPLLFFLYKYKREDASCSITITQGTNTKSLQLNF